MSDVELFRGTAPGYNNPPSKLAGLLLQASEFRAADSRESLIDCLSSFSFLLWACDEGVGLQAPASMPLSAPPHNDRVHSEAFLSSLMRRQLKLSIGCGAAFLVVLLGMPIANYLHPQFMATRVAGFTLSWLVLGVLFFPAVWIIAWIFIRRSMGLEENEVERARLNSR